MQQITTKLIGMLAMLTVLGLGSARAQSSEDRPLAEFFPTVLGSTVTLAPPSVPGFPSHEAHFQPTLTDPLYVVPNQFNAALLASLATFPLGSSSGGFAFVGDPAVGDMMPASNSYGPTFAERALTSGRGNLQFGFLYQRGRYDSFEGKTLEDGDIRFYLQHVDCCEPQDDESFPDPFFEGDLVEASVAMNVSTDTTAFLVNYGLTDRWDVGAAIPIVRVALDADVTARVDRIATGDIPIHQFPGDNPDQRVQSASDSAAGLGDIVLRTKYRLVEATEGGIAVGLDLRLPTGDEKDLLGIGATQAKLLFIGSTAMGAFNPHVNLGYAFAGDSSLRDIGIDVNIWDELSYTFGVDTVVGNTTLAFDIVGRTLFDAGQFSDMSREFQLLDQPSVTRMEFGRSDGDVSQVFGAAGAKVPLAQHLLLTANVLFSINESGLSDRFTPVIGLEYVIPRQ